MRRRRLPFRIFVPVGLVVLVVWLAVLQFRWLGQVSEAERDQLMTSLVHSADAFAADFDQEISQLYIALQQVDGQELAEGRVDDLTQRLERWRGEAQFPDLLDTVYFIREQDPDDPASTLRLQEFVPDQPQLTSVEWPDTLASVRQRLEPTSQSFGVATTPGQRVFEFAFSPVMSDIPALIVHATSSDLDFTPPARIDVTNVRRIESAEPASTFTLDVGPSRSVLVATLDAGYLRQSVLPTLASVHFPQQSAERYRVSIVDRNANQVVTRPEGVVIAEDEADVTAAFFGIRLSSVGRYRTDASRVMAWAVTLSDGSLEEADLVQPRQEAEAAGRIELMTEHNTMVTSGRAASAAVFMPDEHWELRLQHTAGSLDAAVANARTRNLWLSFGILAILGTSVLLTMLNAQRSERLAAQQMDFVATVSHELRTPLTVIRSAAQNLSAGVVLDEKQAQRYGDLIEEEGRRLTDMVEQVLEFAGLSGSHRPPRASAVDTAAVIDDLIDGCRSMLDAEGFELAVQTEPDLPPVMADAEALRRALQNLVTNAVKYAADGRWLGVTARLETSRRGREVAIAVSDHGRGIDADDLPHIFEPFYRGRYPVDRQIHGNGLGLSLVKRIAEAHGGRLGVTSTPGTGTTFTIHLPAVAGEPEPSGLAEPAAGSHSA